MAGLDADAAGICDANNVTGLACVEQTIVDLRPSKGQKKDERPGATRSSTRPQRPEHHD